MKAIWIVLTFVNYLLALFMMYAGVITAIAPLDTSQDRFGWIYGSRFMLVLFGLIFFGSGASLFVSKLVQYEPIIGHSLMAIYLCFVFAALLNMASGSWIDGLPNLVASGIVGLLYLRWKYRFFYPEHRR
jgi:predicted Na+-dependent transporter